MKEALNRSVYASLASLEKDKSVPNSLTAAYLGQHTALKPEEIESFQMSPSLVSLIWSGILGRNPLWLPAIVSNYDIVPDQTKEIRLKNSQHHPASFQKGCRQEARLTAVTYACCKAFGAQLYAMKVPSRCLDPALVHEKRVMYAGTCIHTYMTDTYTEEPLKPSE